MKSPKSPSSPRKRDPFALVVTLIYGVPAVVVLLLLLWLAADVLFLEGSSSCPQNSC